MFVKICMKSIKAMQRNKVILTNMRWVIFIACKETDEYFFETNKINRAKYIWDQRTNVMRADFLKRYFANYLVILCLESLF